MFHINQDSGIESIIQFCEDLHKNGIHFNINYYGEDALTVNVTLVGKRIEISFFSDHIEFSEFAGSEEVLTDVNSLLVELGRK